MGFDYAALHFIDYIDLKLNLMLFQDGQILALDATIESMFLGWKRGIYVSFKH